MSTFYISQHARLEVKKYVAKGKNTSVIENILLFNIGPDLELAFKNSISSDRKMALNMEF